MPTSVFISWSKPLSKKLAEAIKEWLPQALQDVNAYHSSSDIDKGKRWTPELANALQNCDIGLICLTKENLTEPWINFEAGALSKNVENGRVCTLLFDGLTDSDITGPLTAFQNTKFVREDFWKLFVTINKAADRKLDDSRVASLFEKWWPDLENEVNAIHAAHVPTNSTTPQRSDRDLLEELVKLTRQTASDVDSLRKSRKRRVVLNTNPTKRPTYASPSQRADTVEELKARIQALTKSGNVPTYTGTHPPDANLIDADLYAEILKLQNEEDDDEPYLDGDET